MRVICLLILFGTTMCSRPAPEVSLSNCPMEGSLKLNRRNTIQMEDTTRWLVMWSDKNTVRSAYDGEVREVGSIMPATMVIRKDSVTSILYSGLTKTFFKSGQRVKAGDVIGTAEEQENQYRLSVNVWKSKRVNGEEKTVDPTPYFTCQRVLQ